MMTSSVIVNNNNTSSSINPSTTSSICLNHEQLGNKNSSTNEVQLKQEILLLKSQLKKVSAEKHRYEQTFHSIQERLRSDVESSLYIQAQGYEARLTELHSVIGELKRKVEQVEGSRIVEVDVEEDEDEVEETSDCKSTTADDDDGESCASEEGHCEREVEKESKLKPQHGHQHHHHHQRQQQQLEVSKEQELLKTKKKLKRRDNDNECDLKRNVLIVPPNGIGAAETTSKTNLVSSSGIGPSVADLAIFQKEISKIRTEHLNIKKNLHVKEVELNASRWTIQNLISEKNFMQHQIGELEKCLQRATSSSARVGHKNRPTNVNGNEDEEEEEATQFIHKAEPEFCKKAEKVALKTTAAPSPIPASCKKPSTNTPVMLTGPQIHSISESLEHVSPIPSRVLSDSLKFDAQMAEINSSPNNNNNNVNNNNNHNRSSNICSRCKDKEFEIERLHYALENAIGDNEILQLNLQDGKDVTESLTLLVGKYESRFITMEHLLGFSSQLIESYDVLVALLESELGQLLANCRAVGIGSSDSCCSSGIGSSTSPIESDELLEVATLLQRANENRAVAESAAGCLLERMIGDGGGGSFPGFADHGGARRGSGGEGSVELFENPLSSPEEEVKSDSLSCGGGGGGGWGDTMSSTKSTRGDSSHYYSSQFSLNTNIGQTSTTPQTHGSSSHPFTKSELDKQTESQIRSLIIQLKTRFESLKSTLQELPSWNLEEWPVTPSQLALQKHNSSSSSKSCLEARRNDLEIAILMQELMGLKEERAELRGQVHYLDKEKKRLEDGLEREKLKEIGYQAQISLLAEQNSSSTNTSTMSEDNVNNNENSQTPCSNSSSSQVVPTNNNSQINQLIATINKLNQALYKLEQEYGQQLAELANSNHCLLENLNSAKYKYDKRLRKLEEQIVLIVERHVLQIRDYKDKIRSLQQTQLLMQKQQQQQQQQQQQRVNLNLSTRN